MDARADPVATGLDPERLLAALAHAKGLLLAVSGGPDSVALMLLAAHWSGRRTVPIEVATVDHRLRTESRREAEMVAVWAEALGFPHHLLSWEEDKPKTRLQERARERRYALLAGRAALIGADHIVTGHHADDQAETVLLRLTRGTGPAGLAGMAPFARFGEITVARPLLDVPKADLVALCVSAGHPFFKDPSNENPAFARTRLRRLRKLLDAEGLDRPALLRLARRAARAEAALNEIAASTRRTLPLERTSEGVQIARAPLIELADEIFLRILEAEILALSPGRDHLRLDRLERAAAEIASALRANRAFATTLGDARIAATPPGNLQIRRAPPRRSKTHSA
jgi:tRNA(Ile)-lysidine synthase